MAATLMVTVPARMAETSRFGWGRRENEEGNMKTKRKGRRKRRGQNEWQKTNANFPGETMRGR